MLLKYIYIKKYKQFEDLHIHFSKSEENILKSKIYNDLNFTVFVGDNGSGKTTILSFISNIFRNLQRYHDKIPSDFKLTYILASNYKNEITIEKNGKNIYFTTNNKRTMLLEFNLKKREYIEKEIEGFEGEFVTYEDIRKNLPKNIIISAFDIDYPKGYNWNYIGDRILEISDITLSYSKSVFGMDMSKGLLIFIDKYFSKESAYLRKFLSSMGFFFANQLYMHRTFSEDYGEKDKIMEGFHKEFHFNDWENFLKEVNFDSKSDFINWVFSDMFWEQYMEEIDDASENLSTLYNDKIKIEKFINDNFFNMKLLNLLIEKRLIYINDFSILKKGKEFKVDMLSTGEKILLSRLFFILSKIGDDSLIILEEPEIHLNILWVQQLITIINFLFNEHNAHFLISTHNHSFINKLFPEDIILLKDGEAEKPKFNTFFANESEIKGQLFPQMILKDSLEDKVLSIIGQASKEELRYIMDILGESYLKYMVFQRLKQNGDT